jgi:hypothetical protein
MHTFAQLAHVLPRYTSEGIDKFFSELEKLVKEAASYELILDTLTIFKKLFKSEADIHSRF